ncbi:MAG: hypothetical protein PHX51_08390 [Clostridia bacterium]|nr:hypothetical protein [Clostridia bacterium]
MSRRATITTKLKDLLIASTHFGVVKLVSSIVDKNPIDIAIAEMPALKIILPEEDPEYHPSMRAMNKIRADIHIYDLQWDAESTAAEETVLENLRNILGLEYDIDKTAVNIDILKIYKENSVYPLIHFRVACEIMYEESIASV